MKLTAEIAETNNLLLRKFNIKTVAMALSLIILISMFSVCYLVFKEYLAFPADVSLETVDLGDVPEGSVVTRSVEITNLTDRYLKVAGVGTSCGCTTAVKIEGIRPRSHVSLRFRFNSTGHPGQIRKSVGVLFKGYNDPLQISLIGTVYPAIEASPYQLSVAPIKLGESRRASFTVGRPDGQPLQVTGVHVPKGIKLIDLAMNNSRRVRIDILCIGQGDPGQYQEDVTLDVRYPGLSKFSYKVDYVITGMLELSVDKIVFGQLNRGVTKHCRLVIRAANPIALALGSEPSDVTVTLLRTSPSSYSMDAMYTGAGTSGTLLTSSIVLKTNSSKQRAVNIPVLGAIS